MEKHYSAPPSVDGENGLHAVHNLSVLGMTYIVKSSEGSWWKGCCFRPRHVRAILRNISLHAQGGDVTALVGNSGSGKTSLLDIVACRASGQVVGGTYLDGKLMTSDIFRSQAGYVIQSDRLLPNITVRETLTYVARLKFALASKAAIKFRVDQVLSDMGIRHVADSRIGNTLDRGISGGEKRRVSIACQLLQDPILLLLDEPTTGLDSFTAHYLIQTISELAKRRNKVVLLSIHQPRSDIFRLFDNVGILSKGEMVYFGPGYQMVPHFTALGHPCPAYANPLDHYMDLASVDRRSAEQESLSTRRLKSLRNGYFHSPMFKNTLSDIHSTCHFMDSVETFAPNPLGVPAPPGYMMTMGTLVTRMNVNLFRDPLTYLARFFEMSVMSVLMFLFLFQLQHNQESIQDRVGLLYQTGQVSAYVAAVMAASIFPAHRDMFYRESRDGLYSPLVFVNSYLVFMLPLALGCSFCFATINYWALGMYPEAERYGVYFSMVFLLHYAGEVLAILTMAFTMNVGVATSITSLVLAMTGLLSSGFLVSIESMPEALQILSYSTVFKYSSEVLVATEFHGLELECEENSTCTIPDGDTFIDLYFPGCVENFSLNFGLVGCFVFGYSVLAILAYRAVGTRQLH